MRRHETPEPIATALARHAPKNIRRILDPAVGNGKLLEPFFRRPKKTCLEIFAIDSDSRPLRKVSQLVGGLAPKKIKVFHADFLKWAPNHFRLRPMELFDCIVMNPPFAARRQKWKSFKDLTNTLNFEGLPATAPIEAGFVVASVSLLAPQGRLLAILPASLITSPSLGWLRRFLSVNGAIHHVHELPKFSFQKIECRIYLLVYEKGPQKINTILLNHDLKEPEKLLLGHGNLIPSDRLDFGYYNAISKLDVLKNDTALGWKQLDQLASVHRGTRKTPNYDKAVIHTNNFRAGFWIKSDRQNLSKKKLDNNTIHRCDLLVKRVSRNCARSFGTAHGLEGRTCTDCMLIIRPKNNTESIRLLFALRCLMALEFGPSLLEKGTGATYLPQIELRNLEIPYGLSKKFHVLFKKYTKALRSGSSILMNDIEAFVAKKLVNKGVSP